MKTIYIVTKQLWNGTVLIESNFSIYESLELAEKVRDKLSELNNQESSEYFSTTINIESIALYESEREVPILNECDTIKELKQLSKEIEEFKQSIK